VLANAPDLRTAIKSFSRYHRVLTTNRFEFVESAGAGRIEWSYPVTMPNVTQVSDFALMRFVWRIQCLIGASWRPIAVGLIHQEPEDIAEYEKRLGLRIAFNQPANSIAISSATLGLPLPGADAQLFNLVTRFCEEQIEHQNAADDDPLNRVREAIIRCLERGQANPRSVAEEIGVSAGSLDRARHVVPAPARRYPPLPRSPLSVRKLAQAHRHRRARGLFRAQRLQPRRQALVRRLATQLPAPRP